MDLRMPELDGLQATQRIRALPALHGGVPILALTACTFREQIEQCRQAGMDGHIAKPVDYATLIAAVAAAITAPAARWTADPATSPETTPAAEPPPQPTLDRAALDATLAFLTPDEATANLQSLRECQAQMLQLLDQPAAPAVLTQAAHALASNAGMFGFAALCAVARKFEHAMARDAPEADRLGRLMRAEIGAGLTALDALVHECRMQPA
jgi:DNA-binding response OmpR family regulator